jgi:lysophospholipase L1-like esterase
MAGVGAGLILVELGLRLTVGPEYAGIYRVDDHALHALVPGGSKRYRHAPENGGHSVAVEINRDGYRGGDLEDQRDRPRVVVYGDSFVEGAFSELSATFTQRLAGELATGTGRSIEGINAGVSAYGPDQVAVVLQHQLAQLEPDLVVVTIYAGNDFGDLLRNKLFRLGPDGTLQGHPYEISHRVRVHFRRAQRAPMLYKVAERAWRYRPAWLRQSDEAQRSLDHLDRWLREREDEYEEFVVRGDPVVRNLLGDTYEADMSVDPEGPAAVYKRRLMDRVVSRIDSTTRAAGVGLVILIVPSPVDVCELWSGIEMSRDRFPDYRPGALTDAVQQIVERQHLPYVDLFAPFRDAGACQLYFRGGNDHWNDAGQALAARILADYILERGLLENAARP